MNQIQDRGMHQLSDTREQHRSSSDQRGSRFDSVSDGAIAPDERFSGRATPSCINGLDRGPVSYARTEDWGALVGYKKLNSIWPVDPPIQFPVYRRLASLQWVLSSITRACPPGKLELADQQNPFHNCCTLTQ